MKKEPGIPNIFPYKEEMINALERKEQLEQERKDQLKAMKEAGSQLPKGTLENYAVQIQAKVDQYEEEKKEYGDLTKEEFLEAQKLMDPNAKLMN